MLTHTTHPLHDAAMTALQVPLRYAQQGRNMAWAAMGGAQVLRAGRHHPEHDVVDRATQTRFYYHAHPIEGGVGEHGHFHVFQEHGQVVHHLIALSLDAQGRPMRWFCTYPWVTGEAWPPPSDLGSRVAGFRVSTRGKMAPVARWLQAMIVLYSDDIAHLIETRNQCMAGLDRHTQMALGQDREQHVWVSRSIDLGHRIQHILHSTGENT